MTIAELITKLNDVAAVIGDDSEAVFRAGGCQWPIADVVLEGTAAAQQAIIEG